MAESISSRVAWKLRKVISGGSRDTPSRTGIATVQRRDADGTVWVRFPGSSIDTPVTGAVVANVAAGDTISYDLSGGRVSVTGNASDPSAGTSTVRAVRRAAESAAKVASGAQNIADATKQHFWSDDNGAHVSTEKDNPTGDRNILMNSLGILLRQGSSWLASFSDSAVAFYDGLGNTAANVVAQFGADGVVIGRSGESHMELDYHSMRMIDRNGTEYFEVEDLRDESGKASIVDTFYGDGETIVFLLTHRAVDTNYTVKIDGVVVTPPNVTVAGFGFVVASDAPAAGTVITAEYETASSHTKAYTLGTRNASYPVGAYSVALGANLAASGAKSHAEGEDAKATGTASHAEGYDTLSRGLGSHAEGSNTQATGTNSHAEGYDTNATGDSSHAEGSDTQASGGFAHAEGRYSAASGSDSHAEGYYTSAEGGSSHAEGNRTRATGNGSHAQNEGTIAGYAAQTAIGRFNANDANDAFEVGNGTSDSARSNAFAVDWDGYLYPMNEQMPDWVTAQGTDGIWTYRRWHSGVSECWGTYTASIAVDIASASYGGYRSAQVSAAWPTATFVAAPTVTATSESSAGVWVSNTTGSDATAAKFFLSCGASMAAASRSVAIHACGRWK